MTSFEKSFLTILVCLFFVSSCSTTQQAYRQNIRMYFESHTPVTLTSDDVKNSPIDLIYVKIGARATITMALAFIENGNYKWISSDGAMFITNNGRLINTVGLPKDLIYVSNLSNDPISSLQTSNNSILWNRIVDTEHGEFGAKLTSQMTRVNDEIISVQAENLSTKKYVETVNYQSVKFGTDGWTNIFWFHDETGQLLKSSQKASLHSENVEITYLSRTMRLLEK